MMCKNYHNNTAACMYIIKFKVLIINLLFKKKLEHCYLELYVNIGIYWIIIFSRQTVHSTCTYLNWPAHTTYICIYINTRSSLMNSELFSFTNCIAMEFLMLLTVPVLKCTGHLLNCPMSVVIFWPYETDA